MVQTHTITHPENLDLLAWEAFITRLRLFATQKLYLIEIISYRIIIESKTYKRMFDLCHLEK